LPAEQEVGGLPQMNHGGGQQAQAGVVMFKVVPAEVRTGKTHGRLRWSRGTSFARAKRAQAKPRRTNKIHATAP
jgi:hypothetical protein